ncbi:MAG: formate dehydrogenase accessory protein FdhE [Proteobacteria bacterium]|nr:formate dehydrogenase accessory protein FdhE [Pseudomonadota bacterium]MBU1150244.1 formate dehydrogenase accessory protein FdhE [Pseudomonadota bacterium]MBU2026309.1 formate dehydrogenase accessory protein FdhE [Pseudomonadota bacterium]MBU2234329.1 formate dehydrogenase accessory protein FdhE [Pseudomonadota bacterium]MBU2253168.1 formate dehydrogenase accessory protein FdhE [Pseudomonadota bacterium]
MAPILKDSLQTIQTYRKMNPHYTELLDILEEILILREEYRRRMKGESFPVEEKLIAAKMAGGFPLVDFSSLGCDLTEPKEYFLALLGIAEKRDPGETVEMARKIRNGEILFHDLIYESFNPLPDEEEAAEEEEDASFDLVELFIEESLRPALEQVVARHGDAVTKADWSEGYCPICGREPKIGEIRDEEATRYLFCNQCGFQWSFRRIRCPFCGNEEQQTLAYFTIEGDERYRVDVCNACKRYIKIVDFRETNRKADMDVEDIATLHLDMLANDEGYD